MVKTLLFIGIGGALGSVCRYLLPKLLPAAFLGAFPGGTFLVNVLGCLLIGLFGALFAGRWEGMDNLRLLLTVGFCGGFTTFSTFSSESFNLYSGTFPLVGLLYQTASLVCGLAAVWVGQAIGRCL